MLLMLLMLLFFELCLYEGELGGGRIHLDWVVLEYVAWEMLCLGFTIRRISLFG